MPEDRIKHEIEEILERVDDKGKRRGAGPRFRRPKGRGRRGPSLTGWFVVLSGVLLITALVFRNMFLPLALAGAALLLIGYWLAMRSRGGRPGRVTRIENEVTPARLMVAALIALVLGLVLRQWFTYFGSLAFFLFLWAYWIAWPKRTARNRRWRGDVIDYPEGIWAKVRRWIRGRP